MVRHPWSLISLQTRFTSLCFAQQAENGFFSKIQVEARILALDPKSAPPQVCNQINVLQHHLHSLLDKEGGFAKRLHYHLRSQQISRPKLYLWINMLRVIAASTGTVNMLSEKQLS